MSTQNNARQRVRTKWVTVAIIFALILGAMAMLLTGCGRTEKEIDGTVSATPKSSAAAAAQIGDYNNTKSAAVTPYGGHNGYYVYVYITSNIDSNVKKIEAEPNDYNSDGVGECEWAVDSRLIVDTARGSEYTLVRIENIDKLGSLSTSNGTYEAFLNDVTIKYIYARALPTAPVKEGYTFKGWFYDEACTQKFTGSMVEADITLYAGWNINTYNVTFVHNNGAANSTQSMNYKGTATSVTPTDKAGYTFNGWFTDKACQSPYAFSSEVRSDITLYAGWSVKTYKVTFIVDGEVYQTITIAHGGLLGEDRESARLLKMFNVSVDEKGAVNFSGAITEELVLYGALTENAKKWLKFGDWFERIGMWIFITAGVALGIGAVVLIIKKVRGRK